MDTEQRYFLHCHAQADGGVLHSQKIPSKHRRYKLFGTQVTFRRRQTNARKKKAVSSDTVPPGSIVGPPISNSACSGAKEQYTRICIHHARAEQTRLPAFDPLRIRRCCPPPTMPQRSLTSFFGAPKPASSSSSPSSSKMETPGSGSSSKRASPDSGSSDAAAGELATAAAGAGAGSEAGAKRPKVASKTKGVCEKGARERGTLASFFCRGPKKGEICFLV